MLQPHELAAAMSCLNRTRVELKHEYIELLAYSAFRLNRTRVELKRAQRTSSRQIKQKVLIEPEWN